MNEDHAIRGMLIVAKLAGAASYHIKQDRLTDADKYVRAAYEGVRDMDQLYPGSAEAAVSRKTYNIIKREFEVASAS